MSLMAYSKRMRSLPFRSRVVKATEQTLDAIYRAAYAGLKGDRLATAAGMSPQDMSHLIELDPMAREYELRGRTDSELEHANMLAKASREGDAKASLAILQHVHGWTAKQQIDVSGEALSSLQVVFVGADHAIQKQSTRTLDVQPTPGDGEEVGGAYAEPERLTAAR